MRDAGYGRILTLASALRLVGGAGRSGYAASKGAVVDGIDDNPHVRRFLDAEVPMRRWAAAEELTGAALLLTDPQSAYITGDVLPVDGGWTSH